MFVGAPREGRPGPATTSTADTSTTATTSTADTSTAGTAATAGLPGRRARATGAEVPRRRVQRASSGLERHRQTSRWRHPSADGRLPGRGAAEVADETSDLVWQSSLFGAEQPGPTGFAEVTRHHLDGSSWVDHVVGFVHGADVLFERFLHGLTWEQHQRPMYDQIVWEPRLSAGLGMDDAGEPELRVVAALSGHYGADFDTMWSNLYRDGRDSVAWHGDRIRRSVPEPMVAIVSLGATRPFVLRPRGGGESRRLRPAHGDLLVMGGRCQHDWEHCVPKTAEPIGPRISFTLRHSEPGRWAR